MTIAIEYQISSITNITFRIQEYSSTQMQITRRKIYLGEARGNFCTNREKNFLEKMYTYIHTGGISFCNEFYEDVVPVSGDTFLTSEMHLIIGLILSNKIPYNDYLNQIKLILK